MLSGDIIQIKYWYYVPGIFRANDSKFKSDVKQLLNNSVAHSK